MLPEYGKLKERLYEVTRQHGDAKREREELEKQSRGLATDLAQKIREMETAFQEVKFKKTVEITEMSEKLEREYDSRIQQTLAGIRESYESEMKKNKAEFNRKYESKVSGLQNLLSAERSRNSVNSGEEEEAQRRISALVNKVQRLEAENFELNKKVERVISGIEDQKRRHLKELGDKDDKIQKTLKEIQKQMEEYQNLLQVMMMMMMGLIIMT